MSWAATRIRLALRWVLVAVSVVGWFLHALIEGRA